MERLATLDGCGYSHRSHACATLCGAFNHHQFSQRLCYSRSSDACAALLKHLSNPQAKALPHNMVIHCQEFAPLSDRWRQIHYRQTYAPEGVRFYSTGSGKSYAVNADSAAEALLSQAAARVDFPPVIRNAWQDGIRIFIEHGPRNLCSHWINEILGDKNHLAVPLDMMGINPVTQSAYAAAQLWQRV